MPVKLVSATTTYEHVLKLANEKEEDYPVFTMRFLSSDEVNQIDDRLVETTGESGKDSDKFRFLSGTASRLKINHAVVDWQKIYDENGQPIKCTDDNKRRLPAYVQQELLKHIDQVNGLNRKKGSEEEKN